MENKELVDDVYKKISTKNNPEVHGWYDTDKGCLFWYQSEKCWSCRDDKLSEEYPNFWYKKLSTKLKQEENPLTNCILVVVFADNGENSHWTLIDKTTGEKYWSENPDECKATGYPVKQSKDYEKEYWSLRKYLNYENEYSPIEALVKMYELEYPKGTFKDNVFPIDVICLTIKQAFSRGFAKGYSKGSDDFKQQVPVVSYESTCGAFTPSNSTSSATICVNCGKEYWQHKTNVVPVAIEEILEALKVAKEMIPLNIPMYEEEYKLIDNVISKLSLPVEK